MTWSCLVAVELIGMFCCPPLNLKHVKVSTCGTRSTVTSIALQSPAPATSSALVRTQLYTRTQACPRVRMCIDIQNHTCHHLSTRPHLWWVREVQDCREACMSEPKCTAFTFTGTSTGTSASKDDAGALCRFKQYAHHAVQAAQV